MDRSAADFLLERRSLTSLRRAAGGCRGCDLWKDATQTVFGEGRSRAELMLVGEQPGDQEDRRGSPFAGPAGALLDRALVEAGIDRDAVYVTNAVKHFKWKPRGKRRLHQTPRAGEVEACKPWLEAELEAVRPRAVVALDATAAMALFGSSVKVTPATRDAAGAARHGDDPPLGDPAAARARGRIEKEVLGLIS